MLGDEIKERRLLCMVEQRLQRMYCRQKRSTFPLTTESGCYEKPFQSQGGGRKSTGDEHLLGAHRQHLGDETSLSFEVQRQQR